MISSAVDDGERADDAPVLSVVFIVMMPLPPRDWTRYSSKRGALADAVFAGDQQRGVVSTTASATTRSSFSSEMPRTPVAGRPMERTSDSSKADAHALAGDEHGLAGRWSA
jgi:hypothetical protein